MDNDYDLFIKACALLRLTLLPRAVRGWVIDPEYRRKDDPDQRHSHVDDASQGVEYLRVNHQPRLLQAMHRAEKPLSDKAIDSEARIGLVETVVLLRRVADGDVSAMLWKLGQ